MAVSMAEAVPSIMGVLIVSAGEVRCFLLLGLRGKGSFWSSSRVERLNGISRSRRLMNSLSLRSLKRCCLMQLTLS